MQDPVSNHIHSGRWAPFWMPERLLLYFNFLKVLFSLMVKADVQWVFDGPQNKLFWLT